MPRFSTNTFYAFTFIETIIVLGLISILVGMAFPSLRDYYSSLKFNSVIDNTINSIRLAQTNSVIQKNQNQWGICLINDQIIRVYQSACDNDVNSQDYQIPSGVSVSGLDDIAFSQIRGEASESAVIQITSGNQIHYIYIQESGGFTQVADPDIETSTLTINVSVVPTDSSSRIYTLTHQSVPQQSQLLSNGQSYVFSDLLPDNYYLQTEYDPNYTTSIQCSNGFTSSSENMYMPIFSGQNISCDFVHVHVQNQGSIRGCVFEDTNENGIQDTGEDSLSNWDIRINGGSWEQTDNGCYRFQGLSYGAYTVESRITEPDWFNTTPMSIALNVNDPEIQQVTFGYKHTYVKIIIDHIACSRESDLPNWGNGGPDINANTDSNFLSSRPGCHKEPGWYFQWNYPGATNPGDTYYGFAPGWYTVGPTDSSGRATIEVSNLNESPYIWMRTVLQPNYLTFTFGPSGNNNSNNVTGEFYCHQDVMNYDNYDMIYGVQKNQTYYCISWNALK